MAHNRKLVLGGVALTQAKLPAKQSALAMGKARDDLEHEIIQSNYFANAPFKWVGLIIREGLVDERVPHYQSVDAKDGELPVAIEVDTHRLVSASMDEATAVYRKAALLVLLHVGERYNLDVTRLRALLIEMEPEAFVAK